MGTIYGVELSLYFLEYKEYDAIITNQQNNEKEKNIMETTLTVDYMDMAEGISKKNNKPWTRLTVHATNDMMYHVFWNIKPDIIDKMKMLKLERGDLIDIRINLSMSSGRPFVNVIDVERSELI